MKAFGAWLSLVERLVRDQEVQSSNLCAPTTFLPFSLQYVPVALRDGGFGLLQPARGLRRPGSPSSPAREILLEEQPGPPVVAVGQKHPAVEILQIGRRLRRFQCRLGSGEQAAHQRLSFFDQSRCLIGLATAEKSLSVPVHRSQLPHGFAIPGLFSRI